ncbi:asparagine-tRNA ligase chloroplastic/mitochondrial-like, partial [Trifolium pratense]
MSVAMATRPLRLVKPYTYALFSYLNASTPKPSFLRPFSSHRRRFFCSATLPSGANDTTTKVPQFRKKLKVSDVKDDQFDSLGNTLVLQGWVRTLRLQSSVTFLEINDGSCLSNMQCVLDSEVEGYDQVESGLITTGASVWVQGVMVKSQGTKQKVELKLNKLVL